MTAGGLPACGTLVNAPLLLLPRVEPRQVDPAAEVLFEELQPGFQPLDAALQRGQQVALRVLRPGRGTVG